MFSRRKSRTVHSTAYTGVNHQAPASNQPSSGAMAAALTIGNNIKNGGDGIVGRTGSIARSNISRSNSVQQINKSNSLLKRSPSVTKGPHFSNFASTASPKRPVSHYGGIHGNNISYEYDTSGTLDEISEDPSYNNHETVRDLKLTHTTNKNPVQNVKMVKKYIPTPNGIKIIEVPESTMQNEILRNNSIRSGANIGRSPSINSLHPPKLSKRGPNSRSSSLVKPTLGSMIEEESRRSSSINKPSQKATIVTKTPVKTTKKSSITEEQLQLDHLNQQIQQEKEMSKKLELKQLEYEEMKTKRLAHESKLKQLEAEILDLHGYNQNQINDSSTLNSKAENERNEMVSDDNTISSPIKQVRRPELSDLEPYDNNFISPTSSNYNDVSSESDFPTLNPENIIIDEYESKEIFPAASIDPALLKVDEVDLKKSKELEDLTLNESQVDNTGIEDTFNNHHDLNGNIATIEDDFGIEEVALAADDTPILSKEARPTFDAIPSIITDEANGNGDGDVLNDYEAMQSGVDRYLDGSSDENELRAPVIGNAGSSTSSISSDGSPSRNKKPMKSAMKNSSSFNGTTTPNKKQNAARDAYLSLTTAENTRLNSKMSSSQLADLGSPTMNQSHHYPSASPNLNKRMSTTLRKPPPPQGLANKSLRPQSLQIEPGRADFSAPHSAPSAINGGVKPRMSNRSLRDRSSVYVQPIAAHPALDPNYQSPSKLKAAELYAKANKRPVSTFNLQRKSSFSNEHASDGKVLQRSTLREPREEPQYSQPPPPVSQSTQQTTDSRMDSRVPSHSSTIPTSRFADSDDELPSPVAPVVPVAPVAPVAPVVKSLRKEPPYNKYQDPVLTLRAQPAAEKKEASQPKEKKKLGGRLRKLFGR